MTATIFGHINKIPPIWHHDPSIISHEVDGVNNHTAGCTLAMLYLIVDKTDNPIPSKWFHDPMIRNRRTG